MSFATDTLAIAKTAYQDALTGKSTQLNGRRLERHEISALRDELVYWEQKVKNETKSISGAIVSRPVVVRV